MIKKILLALSIGIFGAVFLCQNDQWVHDALGNYVKGLFEQAGNCHAAFKIKEVNLFSLTAVLEDIQVTPKGDAPWQWQAKKCVATISLLPLLLHHKIDLSLALEDLFCQTRFEKGVIAVIDDHIKALLSDSHPTAWPVVVSSLTFKQAQTRVINTKIPSTMEFAWNSQSKLIDTSFKSNIQLSKGIINVLNRTLISELQGDIFVEATKKDNQTLVTAHTTTQCRCNLLPLPSQVCFVRGQWQGIEGIFSITNVDQSLLAESVQVTWLDKALKIVTKATMANKHGASFVLPKSAQAITGNGTLDFNAMILSEDYAIQGSYTTSQVAYESSSIANDVQITYKGNAAAWHGDIAFKRDPLLAMKGSWHWDVKKAAGEIDLQSNQAIKLPGFSRWEIAPSDLSTHIDLNAQGSVKGKYHCRLHHTSLPEQKEIRGGFELQDTILAAAAHFNNGIVEASLIHSPALAVKTIRYTDQAGNKEIDIAGDTLTANQFQGTITVSLLKNILHQLYDYTVQGEGTVAIQGTLQDLNHTQLKIKLEQGVIRLPETYNFMNNFAATLDVYGMGNKIVVTDLKAQMHKGAVHAERGTLFFNDNYALTYAHMPFLFESCLLHIKKDLFAVLSGVVLFSKPVADQPLIKGSIILERSQLSENIFSQNLPKQFFGSSNVLDASSNTIAYDLAIETRKPIRIDTSLLQGSAKISMHLGGSSKNPALSGTIEVLSGEIMFPYRPLHITKGKLYFLPHQAQDPLLEVEAKNKIKKYDVTLRITGSVTNPYVSLESSPSLTEEQILALLLSGSSQGSVNTLVPTLLLQQIKSALLESQHSPLSWNNTLKNILKPFKYIRVVPSLTDPTGRGGLRGALEIDINDRWRATMQKNFSLSEDTRFEVEYLLSDDISVRAIRDERKDVGGEMEMRWKFGR